MDKEKLKDQVIEEVRLYKRIMRDQEGLIEERGQIEHLIVTKFLNSLDLRSEEERKQLEEIFSSYHNFCQIFQLAPRELKIEFNIIDEYIDKLEEAIRDLEQHEGEEEE